MDIVKLLSIKRDDKEKWIKYYNLETYKYYDYVINILPNNQSILEVGSGGGIFYSKYKSILTKRNNKYTCIDIDKSSIKYSKERCNYVNFFVKNIRNFTKKDFKKYDLVLLIQSYIVISNIKKIFKKYFNAKQNGCIIMVNTIFPSIISGVVSVIKPYFSKINNCKHSKALTLNDIDNLGNYLGRTVTNINIGTSLVGFDEYLTIIR
jgi:SAM-dependent methyltransferase